MNHLPITATRVVAVLLADGWHHITPESFTVGTLTFDGSRDHEALGYRFEEANTGNPYGPATFVGPLSGLLAVRQITPPQRARRPQSETTAGHSSRRRVPIRPRPARHDDQTEWGTGS